MKLTDTLLQEILRAFAKAEMLLSAELLKYLATESGNGVQKIKDDHTSLYQEVVDADGDPWAPVPPIVG